MAKRLNALDLLQADHERVEKLFRRFERSKDEGEQQQLMEEACAAITEHADLEESAFYPVVLEATGYEQLMDEAEIEHAGARDLIEQLRREQGGSRALALFTVLKEYVRHHVEEEEQRIFPLVRKTGMDLDAFGEELAERKGMPAETGKGRKPPRRQAAEEGERPSRAAALQRRTGEERKRAPERGRDEATDADEPAPSQEDNQAFMDAHREDLSRTTLRAKWINTPEEHEDRPGQSLVTRSHDVIRRWAEERHATPATTPGGDAERPRVLRFNFPDYDKRLLEISWEAWLRTFDERELVFVFQEHMKAGNPSNFFKFDSPRREHE